MYAVTLLASTLAATHTVMPRECALCGVYAGPNAHHVIDPYLRRADIWPEFEGATCQFEVARGAFVKLSPAACTSEARYRAGRALIAGRA